MGKLSINILFNACHFLLGFHKLREFIITQHPLEGTIQDFWQMIWDHSAQTIVLLSAVDDQEYLPFWPTEQEEIEAEHFKVKLVDVKSHGNYTTRDFTVQSLQDDYELAVRIIHAPNWPHSCSPLNTVSHLLTLVQEWHLEYQNGPIIVVDRYVFLFILVKSSFSFSCS
jgi:receptor-type tyrosine-protein phosphatase gamma